MAPVLPTTSSPRLQLSPAPKHGIAIKIATAAAVAAAAAATASFTLTAKSAGWTPLPLMNSSSSAPLFADIAIIFDRTISLDPHILAAFPATSSGDDHLIHVGLMKKEGIFGRPSKIYYAFGVYADGNDLKQKLKQYQNFSFSELNKNAELMNDMLERDIGMTVRLRTVEGGLSIREIRSKVSKLVEARLPKLAGQDKALLQRFVSLLKDEYVSLNGSIIDLSREPGHVLKISIDGKEVGSIHSKLLCKSVLDLYVGENALDKKAKDIIQEEIARRLMRSWS